MANYHFSKDVDRDLENIAYYTTKRWGKSQTQAYRRDLKRAVETVARFPKIGQRYNTSQNRQLFRYNIGRHVLFYQVADEGILIVRILHQAMDFDRYLEG